MKNGRVKLTAEGKKPNCGENIRICDSDDATESQSQEMHR